jgi:phosphoglucosamine mutase
MLMSRLFGTDGVRGVANFELTPELAFNLGKAGATVLSKNNSRPVMIIGKDTRLSGDLLENALTAGILSMGGNVIKVGVMPTPAIAYLTGYYKLDAGVVISASHNPFEYNGIKFFNSEGYKLSDDIEEKIEDIVIRNMDTHPHITGNKIGRCLIADERAVDIYCNFLLSTIDIRLDGVKIALDCANGASFEIAPRVYRELGAEVFEMADEPDGVNINDKVGSTHPARLQEKVKEVGADIGFAYDGDADRVIVVDERGELVDGDKTICICAKMLKDRGELEKNKVTATVMSNLGLHKYVNDVVGGEVEVTKVGDRYVLESMLKTGSIIGGEQSGHIIFREYATTGDGILSSLQFMKALAASGEKVSALADEIELYPQVLVNARVPNKLKNKVMQDEEVLEAIEQTEKKDWQIRTPSFSDRRERNLLLGS